MNRTALIYKNLSLDWFGVIVAAACFIGLIAACLLRKGQKGTVNEILTVFCIGTPLALVLSRVQYCISKVDLETLGIGYIFTKMHDGGYGLYGAIAGVFVAVLITALLFKASVGEISDCVATVGAGIITAGRFATIFTLDELGFAMKANIFTVNNEADGLDYLAVFYLDGIVEAAIFVLCMGMFLFCYGNKNSRYTKGNIAMVFLMLHGLNQVVMDSLRTVTLCLFDNEFIKASQIIGIVSWLVIMIIFICRLAKKHLFKKGYLGIITAFVLLIIVSVRMEYRVGDGNYISAHIIMGICMLIMAALSLFIVAASGSAAKTASNNELEAVSENVYSFDTNNAQTADDTPAVDSNTQMPYADDAIQNEVAQNEVAQNEVAQNEVAQNDAAQADIAQTGEFAPYDEFDYTYEKIGDAQQSDPSDSENDFDYTYEELGDAQHRFSRDTIADLRKQFAEMENKSNM